MTKQIPLTRTDRLIIDSYYSVLDGLSEYLGNGFEFVLHSLEDLDHSAIKIINGHYSGRTVGAPITDLALNLIKGISNENSNNKNRIYHNRSKKGSPIRAATLPISGENNRIIGLICINFYMDLPLISLLESWYRKNNEFNDVSEILSENSNDLISDSLSEAKSLVLRSEGIPRQNQNKAIIEILYQKGIFKLKDSVQRVAEMLAISPNTVYLHLRATKKQDSNQL